MKEPYKGSGKYYNNDGTVNIHGGPKDGMIRTEADMDWVKAMIAAGYEFQPNKTIGKNNIWCGDYIYADLNGDGKYGNSYDYRFQDVSKDPKYTFGMQMSASWNGFDISMNWAGAACETSEYKVLSAGAKKGADFLFDFGMLQLLVESKSCP